MTTISLPAGVILAMADARRPALERELQEARDEYAAVKHTFWSPRFHGFEEAMKVSHAQDRVGRLNVLQKMAEEAQAFNGSMALSKQDFTFLKGE